MNATQGTVAALFAAIILVAGVSTSITPTQIPELTQLKEQLPPNQQSPQYIPHIEVGDLTLSLTNGYWCTVANLTAENCAALLSTHNVGYVYPQVGQWQSDGSILELPSEGEITTAVTNAQAAGLKVYPWVIDDTENVPIATGGQRDTAIASLIDLLDTYGFDGVADDIEIWHTYSDLITFWNAATVALNAEGYEYFTTVIPAWVIDGEMTTEQLASIQVDRLQPMLYDLWGDYETIHKTVLNRVLTYCTTPIGVALPTFGTEVLADSIAWTDEQLTVSPKTYLVGFDVFDYGSTSAGEFTTWDNWQTKNALTPSAYAGFSSYPRTLAGAYSTDIIDDIIAQMDEDGLNVYRMSIYYTVNDYTRDTMIQYFLDNCSYDLIVCRHKYDPGGDMSSAEWTAAQAWALDVCSTFSAYEGRLWVEFENEAGDSDLATQCQTIVTAVRNAGYGHRLVANKWNQTWSSMAGVTDPQNKFYTGYHYYFNSWSVSGAISQMNTALAAGCLIFNTEIGADFNEETQFSSSEVQEVTDFMAWCADTEYRNIGNAVWQRYGLQNYDTYQALNLVWPSLSAPIPEPPFQYAIAASDDAHSTITPSGSVDVNAGANQTFTFATDEGYVIDSVTVDGGAVTVADSYTFLNVMEPHTIVITSALGEAASPNVLGAVATLLLT